MFDDTCRYSKNSGKGRLQLVAGFFLILVILALSAGFIVMHNPDARLSILEYRLARMPYADYSADIVRLMDENRYEAADGLAAFVLANPVLPNPGKARALKSEIERLNGNRSSYRQVMSVIDGFLSGGGDSAEERIGGLIANLLGGSGLPEDMIPRRTPNVSDDVYTALQQANLGVNALWFPAVMRTLRASGLTSPLYDRFLIEEAEKSADDGAPTAVLSQAISDTRELVSLFGIERTMGLFCSIRNVDDMNQLLRWGRIRKDETFVISVMGGTSLLPLLPEIPRGEVLLQMLAQKGQPALTLADYWLKGAK